MKRKKDSRFVHQERGFALIATISVMVLLVMIALAMLSLATIELRQVGYENYQNQARANARMALMIAMGELQKYAGPDQRVTARADILDGMTGKGDLYHKNWLGVWKTTFEANGKGWPLVGMAPERSSEPYPHKGIYTDLRETEGVLSQGKWKEKLLESWLVSKHSEIVTPWTQLSEPSADGSTVIELLGRGTLGSDYSDTEYEDNRVLVEKVDVSSGSKHGAYAWYVSDNNQKASIALDPDAVVNDEIKIMASQTDNPTSVISSTGGKPYANYVDSAQGNYGKLLTDKSAGLVGGDNKVQRDALSSHFHHFTTHGQGLFTDVVMGGLKKDLSPLLFGKPNEESLSFASPSSTVAAHPFSSDYPIIPNIRHAVLGPSFAALRYWGRQKNLSGLTSGVIEAQVDAPRGSTYHRPVDDWPTKVGRVQRADGLAFDGGEWATKAPKIHPVMTDARWHYYFSHTEGGAGKMRTHILPRVCLWNPYNVTMKTDQLLVLMPNPLRRTKSFEFIFDEGEVARLKARYPDPQYHIKNWGSIRDDGSLHAPYKISYNDNTIFPDDHYLGFVLEASELEPGECLVFSPLVSSPVESSQGVSIQRYNKDDISKNVLSAKKSPGEDHYVVDYTGSFRIRTGTLKPKLDANGDPVVDNDGNPVMKKVVEWKRINDAVFQEMKLGEIMYYEPWAYLFSNFPFILKGVDASLSNKKAWDIVDRRSRNFPTLQLVNNGNGGVSTYNYWYYAWWWGTSDSASDNQFGSLESFREAPKKNPPALHQFGTKLCWLDESATEGNGAPLRSGKWTSNHVVYNPAVIAQWNVRPGIVTRSPASMCGAEWYVNSGGGWIQQFSPLTPQDSHDMPSLDSRGNFRKSPFGLSTDFAVEPNAVMFDLPSPQYGALSLGALRHAQLSQYSWHPTYIVGESLANCHAPFDSSAKLSLAGRYTGSEKSSWDEAIGGSRPYPLGYGPRTWTVNSTGLLQIGSKRVTKRVDGKTLTSKDEVLPYDIAFEVNQNLWDGYFFSGIPMKSDGSSFNWDIDMGNPLWNERYQLNMLAKSRLQNAQDNLNGSSGLEFGFWHNAYLLQNGGAFNVNSTSVEAWTAFLSGLQGISRVTESGTVGDKINSVFARVRKPLGAVDTGDTGAKTKGGWAGGRILSEGEILLLAQEIVKEVKKRGPFVSLADFVNRRLAAKESGFQKDSPMMCGALEAAITRSGLNSKYEEAPFLTTTNVANDFNRDDGTERWKIDVDQQPKSKAWGIPGYLTQGDILEPMAPAMTVRGDSFTIRCYGESRKGDKVMAKAYLEAVVVRSPDYVQSAPMDASSVGRDQNKAIDPALIIKRDTGELIEGNLSEINKKFGRKFLIKSFRWLSSGEV